MNSRRRVRWSLVAALLVLAPAFVFGQATIGIDASDNLTYTGSGLNNNLTISYSGGTYTFSETAEIINVTNNGTGSVTGSGTNTVTVTNVASMTVLGSSGQDSLRLNSSSAINIAFDTGTGVPNDRVILGNGTTANILGTVSVDDGGGVGEIEIDDSAESGARTVSIVTNLISGATPNPVSVVTSDVQTVVVSTGSGDDTFTSTSWNVGSWAGFITLNGGAGSDLFNITALDNPDQTIVGGTPTPPTSPGDQINVNLGGVTNPTLSGSLTATGYQGDWSYPGVTRTQHVRFSEIETYTPVIASQIVVVSGDGQSTRVGTAFAQPLVVRVTDPLGVGVSGVTVTFTPPGSGASASLTTPAVTDANGETQVTATANGTAGAYTVTVTAAGVAGSVTFNLANSAEGIPALAPVGLALLALLVALASLALLHRRM